jgi:hypothetical protein
VPLNLIVCDFLPNSISLCNNRDTQVGKQLRGMFNADKGEFDLHMINLLIPNTHIIISLVHTHQIRCSKITSGT